MRVGRHAGLVAAVCLAVLAGGVTPAAARVTQFRESFEHGPIGSRPTAANTAYDQSIGDRGDGNGTIAAVFDRTGERGHSVRFYNTRIGRPSFGFLGKRVGRQKVVYLRRYYRLTALPKYRTSVLLYKYGGGGNGQLGGTHNGSFAFGGSAQAHRFTLVNNNTNTTRSKATVPVNRWFRVEVKLDFTSGTGRQTVRLFLGSHVNSTRPTETFRGRLTGRYTDYIEDGIVTNPGSFVKVRIDEARDANRWIGPIR